MKHNVDAWVSVELDPLNNCKVWINFRPPYEVAQQLAEEEDWPFNRAVRALWTRSNRAPKDFHYSWEDQDPYRFAYEWMTADEAKAYIQGFQG